jgi:hypothetical protein
MAAKRRNRAGALILAIGAPTLGAYSSSGSNSTAGSCGFGISEDDVFATTRFRGSSL